MLVHKWSISAFSIIAILLATTELVTESKTISIPSAQKQLDLYTKLILLGSLHCVLLTLSSS